MAKKGLGVGDLSDVAECSSAFISKARIPKKAHQYTDISCTSSQALFAEAKREIPTPPAVKMLIWLSMVKGLVITDPVVLKERIVVSVLMLYIF